MPKMHRSSSHVCSIESFASSHGFTACDLEAVGAVSRAEAEHGFGYGVPKVRYGAGGGFAEQRLAFAEGPFDRWESGL